MKKETIWQSGRWRAYVIGIVANLLLALAGILVFLISEKIPIIVVCSVIPAAITNNAAIVIKFIHDRTKRSPNNEKTIGDFRDDKKVAGDS